MSSVSFAACGHGVVLSYENDVAIDTSDFTIPSGTFTTLIGPNGSGKSTMLGAIAGLKKPTSGTIEVLGDLPTRAQPRVALVPQSTRVNDLLPVTVGEVVRMGRYATLGLLGRFGDGDREAVDTAIERLDLGELVDRHIGELSGGQRQRVFVAQGLAQTREILLLDEPQTALDLPSAAVVAQVIQEERSSGRTVVVTTHDLAEAALSDHVLLLSGRVVAEGPPSDVLRAEVLSEAYHTQIVELDGTLVFDDPAHSSATPHVHLDRGTGTHPH